MGKSIPSTTKLQEFAKIMASDKLQMSKRAKPISRIRVSSPESVKPGVVRVDSEKKKIMESSVAQQNQNQNRLPLAQVVSDCVKRWFQDTLKEAKAGDSAMQVLVGQMYSRGYGVPKDPFKVLTLSLLSFAFCFNLLVFFFFLINMVMDILIAVIQCDGNPMYHIVLVCDM